MTGDLGIDTDGSFVTMGDYARQQWEERLWLHANRIDEAVRDWERRGFPQQTLVEERVGPREEVTEEGAVKRIVHSWVHPSGRGLTFPKYCFPTE